MKSTRKLASLLLALVMVFALAVTAFADEPGTTTPVTGTITVANPVAERTYTAYKIFDVVYDDAKVNYSYTIDSSTSEWFETVRIYANDTAHGLKLTQVNGGDTYVVTTGTGFRAPDFAVALKAAVSGKIGRPLSGDANSVSVSNLKLGYYFVSSDTGALCNLTTTDPEITIYDKNDMPFSKTDDKVSAEVGETVNYTITGKVPNHTGFTEYTYLVTDTMSKGLTFNKNVNVTVGGTDVTTSCTRTYDVDNNANKFTVSIPVKGYTIGDEILVTYSALVNENAVAKISKNSATLTYSNNPSDSTETTSTPTPVEETVYSSKIVIDKFETGKKDSVKLPGAQFVLYKKVTETSGEVTKYYKKWDETTDETAKAVTWVDTIAEATTVKTDENGAASFDGLADGTYYLVETKAPAGYNQLTEAQKVEVHVGENNTPVTSETQLSVTAEVANSTGTVLPSTGGMGTTVFYVLGFVLVVGAGVLLVTKKRMSQGEV